MSNLTKPPKDNDELRQKFLESTAIISELMAELREYKMDIYGMNWMKRGFDSLFQNLDRKFGIIEEILWQKIIVRREPISDEDFVHLCDAFIDLGNYSIFGRWYMNIIYPQKETKLAAKVEERTEVNLSAKKGEQE